MYEHIHLGCRVQASVCLYILVCVFDRILTLFQFSSLETAKVELRIGKMFFTESRNKSVSEYGLCVSYLTVCTKLVLFSLQTSLTISVHSGISLQWVEKVIGPQKVVG